LPARGVVCRKLIDFTGILLAITRQKRNLEATTNDDANQRAGAVGVFTINGFQGCDSRSLIADCLGCLAAIEPFCAFKSKPSPCADVAMKSGGFGNRNLPYISPEQVQDAAWVRVLIAKDDLSTGWDCPRR